MTHRRLLPPSSIILIAALLAVVAFLFQCPRAAFADETHPQVGLWLSVWWTKDDQFHHWANCTRLPSGGRYTAGDPAVIARQFAQFRDIGIDFLILDDTNNVGNDAGRINDNIRAWFDFMDLQPAAQRIPLCIAGGGEMRDGGKPRQQQAADFYWANWATRPSYFHLEDKPLLLIDTDKNYGPGDFADGRFCIRWAYNGDNFAAIQQRKTWGWGSYAPAPVLEECMSIWPGHRYARKVAAEGKDTVEEPREGGRLYVRAWLAALKAHPRYLTIADWNNFEEETAIEDSDSWEDPSGYATPDLYRRITRAYCRLRSGELVEGEYYRDENRPEVYRFDGKSLKLQAGMPKRAAVIVTPAGMLEKYAPGNR